MGELQKKTETGVEVVSREQLSIQLAPKNIKSEIKRFKRVSDIEAGTSIALVRKQHSEGFISGIIALHVKDLTSLLNLHLNLTTEQIIEVADELVAEYYFLSVEEIAFVFRRARLGYYGEIKHSLSIPTIFTWFAKFTDEKADVTRAKQSKDATSADTQINNLALVGIADKLSEIKDKIAAEHDGKTQKEKDYQKWKQENGY